MKLILGGKISVNDIVNVARYGYQVCFSTEYIERVKKSQNLVDKWVNEGKIMYGITTGFGALCNKVISKEEAKQLQKNIVISHAVSVGNPMSIEEVRAIMTTVLLNAGSGYSGIRIETLERYRFFLNENIIPFVPKEGSVGYLAPEAHIAAAIIGIGKFYYKDKIYEASKIFEELKIQGYELSYKEGLVLVSGTTSPTAFAALSIYDMVKAVKTADVIGALNLEISKGTLRAYDPRVMEVRPHENQSDTAYNVREILKDSKRSQESYNYRLQDALSLRAIPQAHGAVKKTFYDALKTIEIEINSSTDNPIIWPNDGESETISSCNCDSGYVGIEMDSCAIAATYLAKMSERRNNRLINANISEFPWFLIEKPGLNSGLMIPQYTQAGLLNDMKILSTPASIDGIPTCGDQEDYVAMGYNSCKKALEIVNKLEYILSIELLSIYRAIEISKSIEQCSSITKLIFEELKEDIPDMQNDVYLYPIIEMIKNKIHEGKFLKLIEKKLITLK